MVQKRRRHLWRDFLSYTTPAESISDNGALFSVTVSNSARSLTSSGATLSVTTSPVAPSVTNQPTGPSVFAGQTAAFSVIANGTSPLSYQWRKNRTSISGATFADYAAAAETTSDNGALFSVSSMTPPAASRATTPASLSTGIPSRPALPSSPPAKPLQQGRRRHFRSVLPVRPH